MINTYKPQPSISVKKLAKHSTNSAFLYWITNKTSIHTKMVDSISYRFNYFAFDLCKLFDRMNIEIPTPHGMACPADFLLYQKGNYQGFVNFIIHCHPMIASMRYNMMWNLSSSLQMNIKTENLCDLPKLKPICVKWCLPQWEGEIRTALNMNTTNIHPIHRFHSLCQLSNTCLKGTKYVESWNEIPTSKNGNIVENGLSIMQSGDDRILIVCVTASEDQAAHDFETVSAQLMAALFLAHQQNISTPNYNFQKACIYGVITTGKVWFWWKFDGRNYSYCPVPDMLGRSTDYEIQLNIAKTILGMIFDAWLRGNIDRKVEGIKLKSLRKQIFNLPRNYELSELRTTLQKLEQVCDHINNESKPCSTNSNSTSTDDDNNNTVNSQPSAQTQRLAGIIEETLKKNKRQEYGLDGKNKNRNRNNSGTGGYTGYIESPDEDSFYVQSYNYDQVTGQRLQEIAAQAASRTSDPPHIPILYQSAKGKEKAPGPKNDYQKLQRRPGQQREGEKVHQSSSPPKDICDNIRMQQPRNIDSIPKPNFTYSQPQRADSLLIPKPLRTTTSSLLQNNSNDNASAQDINRPSTVSPLPSVKYNDNNNYTYFKPTSFFNWSTPPVTTSPPSPIASINRKTPESEDEYEFVDAQDVIDEQEEDDGSQTVKPEDIYKL